MVLMVQTQQRFIDQRRVAAITGVLLLHIVVVGALLLPREPLHLTLPTAPEPEVTVYPTTVDPPPPPPMPPPPIPVRIQPAPMTAPTLPAAAPTPQSRENIVVDAPGLPVMPPGPVVDTPAVPATGVPNTAVNLETLRTWPIPYPRRARAGGIEGDVELLVLVGTDGLPREIKVSASSGNRELDAAAVRAIKRWIFKPYQLDGTPREVWAAVPVKFRLDHD